MYSVHVLLLSLTRKCNFITFSNVIDTVFPTQSDIGHQDRVICIYNCLSLSIDEDGRLYIFYGGSNFPTGNATFTKDCLGFSPCPWKTVNLFCVICKEIRIHTIERLK